MHELGFDSGEQMIAAYGLQGALEKLLLTDGTIAAMVKLIPNIRALEHGAARDRRPCHERVVI